MQTRIAIPPSSIGHQCGYPAKNPSIKPPTITKIQ